MKKNILAIAILAATLINLTLTAVSLFIVVPTATRTSNLVDKVNTQLDLEIYGEPIKTEKKISVNDISNYTIPDKLTIQLKKLPGDTKSRHVQMKVTILLDKTAKDYEATSKQLEEKVESIKDRIRTIVTNYSIDTINESQDIIKEAIKTDLQEYFASEAIYEISFGEFLAE